eukprot:176220-Chlamydomonas_euryale.AAC.5
MEEVYRIRETHDELSKLMRPEEAASLGLSTVFEPLMRVPALQVLRAEGGGVVTQACVRVSDVVCVYGPYG